MAVFVTFVEITNRRNERAMCLALIYNIQFDLYIQYNKSIMLICWNTNNIIQCIKLWIEITNKVKHYNKKCHKI